MIMSKDMLSQEEIDALLKGNDMEDEDDEMYNFNEETYVNEANLENTLSDIEIDALGEIGNISMGTAATTLSTLLNKKVSITTPKVEITTTEELAHDYKMPFVAIDVSYKSGLEGSNILILNNRDAKIISDIMMGKEEFDTERELSELDLSAVGEAMNQMIGSASTSLSEMLMKTIDIEPPVTMEITFPEGKQKIEMLKTESPIIKISFKMIIGNFVDSNIMQLIPINFGKEMVDNLMNPTQDTDVIVENKPSSPTIETNVNESLITERIESKVNQPNLEDLNQQDNSNITGGNFASNSIRNEKDDMVVVKKPEFQNFNMEVASTPVESIDLVGDIPIKIVVELGRTHKNISEILEFGQGTVIELEKLVGEALNIYANGKFIARGEVVVIDDNFGVRVTEVENTNKKII